jgi:hypothetical protein
MAIDPRLYFHHLLNVLKTTQVAKKRYSGKYGSAFPKQSGHPAANPGTIFFSSWRGSH